MRDSPDADFWVIPPKHFEHLFGTDGPGLMNKDVPNMAYYQSGQDDSRPKMVSLIRQVVASNTSNILDAIKGSEDDEVPS